MPWKTSYTIFRLFGALFIVTHVRAWPSSTPIRNLVTFGDSYTDVGMDGYNNGTSWPEYVQHYTNVNLFPFAVGGAVCSRRTSSATYTNDVLPAQMDRYFALVASGAVVLDPAETVYTLWIGTNDIGPGFLLTGKSMPGVSIVDVTACTMDWARQLYASGARNFVFQNMVPLELCPQYSVDAYPNRFWTADRNTTEWHIFTRELVASGNALSRLMVANLAQELPDATIGYFESYRLFNTIYHSPEIFLNGTAPLNVTGCVAACVFDLHQPVLDGIPIFNQAECTVAQGTDRDSFMWYDELHPSEQTNRIVARAISDLLERNDSVWTTFYNGPQITAVFTFPLRFSWSEYISMLIMTSGLSLP